MARKEKKYHFIYKTTNLLTSRYYIGMHSTNDLNDGYMGSGKRLRYSINKYGKENHKVEILEFFDSRKKLIAREKEIVNLNEIAKDECMNLMSGGQGGFVSEEQQKKRSSAGGKALKFKLNTDSSFKSEWNIKHSLGIRNAIDSGRKKTYCGPSWIKGKHLTDEHKNKIGKSNSVKQKGEKNSQFGTCWITRNEINKKIKKEEVDLYIKEGWCIGKYKSVKFKKPNLKILKKEVEENGVTWASKKYKVSRRTIGRWLK